MKQVTLNGREILLVEVPEGAEGIRFIHTDLIYRYLSTSFVTSHGFEIGETVGLIKK